MMMKLVLVLATIFAIEIGVAWRRWRWHFPPGYDRHVSDEQVKAAMADVRQVADVALGTALVAVLALCLVPR